MCICKIAVTGGIACGKSAVGALLSKEGVCVLDTDAVVSGLIDEDTETSKEVIAVFGENVRGQPKGINRAALARIVFFDQGQREALNRIIHPVVEKEWTEWLSGQPAEGAAAVQIPLLYEIDRHEGWDAVICLWSSVDLQMLRLAERGMTQEDAHARIEAQMPVARKAELADYVIVNNDTMENLMIQVKKVLTSILES